MTDIAAPTSLASSDGAHATTEAIARRAPAPAAPAAGAAARPTTETVAGAPSNIPDWRNALPEDVRPLAQAKGWKSPADALKSYAHLERLIGADKVALPPKDAAGNRDWSKWEGWAALGRPEAPERYAFRTPEGQAATEVDRAFKGHMAPLLHKAGLAQWQVDLLSGGLDEFSARHRAQLERREHDELAATEGELRREWDSAFDRHMDLANRAVRRFGGQELASALGKSGLGRHPAVIRAFARIGAALAEDSTLPADHGTRGGDGGSARVGSAGARQEIQRLKGDAEFQAAFLNRMHPGHDAAMTRMLRLQAQASGPTTDE